MMVYEKLSSLSHDLGYSAKALYTASNSIFKHYHTVQIPKKNAASHVGADTILKMDIKHFFDHITYAMVKKRVFPADKYSESNRFLLSVLCVYAECTPQGAPTLPYISNIIMRNFDNRIGEWCAESNIKYTRYCDDMTFSGTFSPGDVIKYVTETCKDIVKIREKSGLEAEFKGKKGIK